MISAELVETIDLPPDTVFGYLADRTNELAWNPMARSVDQLDSGPIRLGTRFRARYRMFGELELRVSEHDRPHRLTFESGSRLAQFRHSYTLDAAGAGTRLRQFGQECPRGAGRIILAMIGPINRRIFRANATRLIDQLRTSAPAAESSTITEVPPGS